MTQKGHARSIYFDPVRIGQSLREIGIDYLKVESKEIETRWFQHAESETDVFVWFDKNQQIIKQQASHMGHLVEWNIIDGLKTGYLMEAELVQGQVNAQDYPASEVIHFDKVVHKQTLKNMISIVQNMQCLSDEVKERVLKNFQRYPDASEASDKPQNFWNKLLSVFKKSS